jgi:hypothetical protein
VGWSRGSGEPDVAIDARWPLGVIVDGSVRPLTARVSASRRVVVRGDSFARVLHSGTRLKPEVDRWPPPGQWSLVLCDYHRDSPRKGEVPIQRGSFRGAEGTCAGGVVRIFCLSEGLARPTAVAETNGPQSAGGNG